MKPQPLSTVREVKAVQAYVAQLVPNIENYPEIEQAHKRVIMLTGDEEVYYVDVLSHLCNASLLTRQARGKLRRFVLRTLTQFVPDYEEADDDEVFSAAGGYVVLHVDELDSCVIYLINYK